MWSLGMIVNHLESGCFGQKNSKQWWWHIFPLSQYMITIIGLVIQTDSWMLLGLYHFQRMVVRIMGK